MPDSRFSRISEVEFNRPADITAYTAKDAISNATSGASVLTFNNITPDAANFGYIVKARLMTNKAAWGSTNAAVMKLHLYSTAPTAINDNFAWTALYANRYRRIGTITFPALATEGTGSDAAYAMWTGAIMIQSNDNDNIFGLLEVDSFSGTLTPDSGQSFYIQLTTDCNP